MAGPSACVEETGASPGLGALGPVTANVTEVGLGPAGRASATSRPPASCLGPPLNILYSEKIFLFHHTQPYNPRLPEKPRRLGDGWEAGSPRGPPSASQNLAKARGRAGEPAAQTLPAPVPHRDARCYPGPSPCRTQAAALSPATTATRAGRNGGKRAPLGGAESLPAPLTPPKPPNPESLVRNKTSSGRRQSR